MYGVVLNNLLLLAGYKGNLTEHVLIVAMSLIFTVTSFFGFLYLLLWQTYVLRADVILNSIQIAFICLEIIFSIICIIVFARYHDSVIICMSLDFSVFQNNADICYTAVL